MVYNSFFVIIIAIIVIGFILDNLLLYLNSKFRKKPLPEILEKVFDSEKLNKMQLYHSEKESFEILSSTISFVSVLTLLFLGAFGKLNDWIIENTEVVVLQALYFFGIIGIVGKLFSLPFDYYVTFTIEEKFGFNKTTLKTFWLDNLKSSLLAIIIGGILISVIVLIYIQLKGYFWIIAFIITGIFSVIISMFYTTLILPIFNKQSPLEENNLKSIINSLGQKTKFKIDNIYVMDGSKRSTKANAFFSGLGKKKRIVLYDTLINDLSENEVVAVLAHEIGHYKKKHTLFSVIISLITTLLMFYLLSIFVANAEIANALGSNNVTFHLGLIGFAMLYSPVSTILSIFQNIISRKFEFHADNYAAEYSSAKDLIYALKKLSVNSLSNVNPHPLIVFISYSHPSLAQRIQNLQKK